MAYNEVIRLLNIKEDKDDYGNLVEAVESEKEVFAELRSIGLKEFYEAAATGLKPEHTFRIADYYDYNDEQFIEWNGKRYTVLRIFRKSEETPLDITVTNIINKGGVPYATT